MKKTKVKRSESELSSSRPWKSRGQASGLTFVWFTIVGIAALIGGILLVANAEAISASPKTQMPPLVFSAAGYILCFIALLNFKSLAVFIFRKIRHHSHISKYPECGCLKDYPWDLGHIKEINLHDFMDSRFMMLCFGLAFASMPAIYLYSFFKQTDLHTKIKILFPIVFGVVSLIFFYVVIKSILQKLKYGVSELEFAAFPFSPGEELDATLT